MTYDKMMYVQQEQSVQDRNTTGDGRAFGSLRYLGYYDRGPLLPPYASVERTHTLRSYYHHDNNGLFRSAIGNLVKRVQSTPWQLKADDNIARYFEDILRYADFGDWSRFVSKIIMDYSRFDKGAFIEVIGPGDADGPLTGPITGVAVLDPLRCYPTGDPAYPVYYWSIYGEWHRLHHTRCYQFVDMPESDQYAIGYGDCALSRSIGSVVGEILLERYTQSFLDDKPAPGFLVARGLNEQVILTKIEEARQRQLTDGGGMWGRTAILNSMAMEAEVGLDFVGFTQAPEKFDYIQYKEQHAREMAQSIGVDFQDVWGELAQQNLGSGTQSQILEVKARGKALGRILKGIERFINQVLPEEAEFTFEYRDHNEDLQAANKAEAWARTLETTTVLSQEEKRRILAQQNESIADVVYDNNGQLIRLNDSDPTADGQENVQVSAVADVEADAEQIVEDKAYSTIYEAFKAQFAATVDNALRNNFGGPAALRLQLRQLLNTFGERAYREGLEAGGARSNVVARLLRAPRSISDLRSWRASQNNFIRGFVNELTDKGMTPRTIGKRAELWANMSLNEIYYKGVEGANRQQRYMWVVNPVKEHCRTCLKLNGQIHRMKEYTKRNLIPNSRALACGGWQCGCRLVPADEPARGRLASVPSVRSRREYKDYCDDSSACGHTHKEAKLSSITYNGVTVQASARRDSTRADKKFMRDVMVDGNRRVVH